MAAVKVLPNVIGLVTRAFGWGAAIGVVLVAITLLLGNLHWAAFFAFCTLTYLLAGIILVLAAISDQLVDMRDTSKDLRI